MTDNSILDIPVRESEAIRDIPANHDNNLSRIAMLIRVNAAKPENRHRNHILSDAAPILEMVDNNHCDHGTGWGPFWKGTARHARLAWLASLPHDDNSTAWGRAQRETASTPLSHIAEQGIAVGLEFAERKMDILRHTDRDTVRNVVPEDVLGDLVNSGKHHPEFASAAITTLDRQYRPGNRHRPVENMPEYPPAFLGVQRSANPPHPPREPARPASPVPPRPRNTTRRRFQSTIHPGRPPGKTGSEAIPSTREREQRTSAIQHGEHRK